VSVIFIAVFFNNVRHLQALFALLLLVGSLVIHSLYEPFEVCRSAQRETANTTNQSKQSNNQTTTAIQTKQNNTRQKPQRSRIHSTILSWRRLSSPFSHSLG
jgi:hypothetical protein